MTRILNNGAVRGIYIFLYNFVRKYTNEEHEKSSLLNRNVLSLFLKVEMFSVSSVTSVGKLFQRDGPVVVQTSSASNEERRVFPVHDSLCFAVDGVQDCPTCAPLSRPDTTAPPHADICKPEDQA